MAYLHGKGIAHGDLKPDNVFMSFNRQLKQEVVKVLDFGLAKALVDAPVDAAISDSPRVRERGPPVRPE